MLAAHLALATLTIGPVGRDAVSTPEVAAVQRLSSQPKVVLAVAEPVPTPAFASAVSQPETTTTPAPADPFGDIAAPANSEAKPTRAASLDDIEMAAPKTFPDPLEPINRISYAISQPIDRFILRPAAIVYKTVIPKPARDGARNAISNFGEPIVFLNDVIQLRPKRAIRTLGRFLINSILGLGGIFDIAKRKPFHIEHHNNGFADTLGYIGIGPILYVYLPVLGPTTLRDSAGSYGDSYFWDRNLHKLIHPNGRSPYFRTQPKLGKSGKIITLINGLDQRAENDDDLRRIKSDSVDPYAALRASFLQDRAGEIAELRAKDGEVPKTEAFDDPLVDPAGPAAEPAPATPAAP